MIGLPEIIVCGVLLFAVGGLGWLLVRLLWWIVRQDPNGKDKK